jgi:hypothetical protein
MRSLILAPAALAACIALVGCDSGKEPRKLSDKEASRIVANVNRGASFQIEPEPILEEQVKKLRFRSAGCVFSPGTGGHGAIALAMKEAGYIKVDGEIVRFAADSGSRELRPGVRTRYFGTTYWFKLALTDADGGAHLTVGDHADVVVFDSEGKIWCDETAVPAKAPESSAAR